VNGSTLAQSRNCPSCTRGASRRGSTRRVSPAQTGVHTDNAVPSVDAGQLDLVRPHQARALDVDQLPLEHVLLEQHLLGTPLERPQVEPDLTQLHVSVPDLTDQLRGDEHAAAGHRRQHAADDRIVGAQPHHHVVDTAQLAAGAVAQHATGDQREVQDRQALSCSHAETVLPAVDHPSR
jgi:hypothetical protein